jgi:signal transduction histidine kinase
MASPPLRILFVEDREKDVELLVLELRRGGYDLVHERVDTPEAFGAALDRQGWDIILCDYLMPRFSAPAALALVKEKKVDLPFIVVSGTVGEETAVEALRAGAHDFMAKDTLARLLPAIDRELREAASRAERKKMHEQLLISERMASVGTLAAGVAHEINNPLAVLMANLDFAVKELGMALEQGRASDRTIEAASLESLLSRIVEAKEPLEDAREAANRVREIVRDIKIFSRSGNEEQRGPVDVRRVMESSLRMVWNEIRHRARLVKDFEEVPAAEGNEFRLGQVFLNLLVNAAQAIPEGRLEANEIRIIVRPHNDERILVAVRDTGSGIAPENIPRIFDPFFTTKPVGVGTGLGLAICHRIVTSLGGKIQVESGIGKGTTFQILLPVARTKAVLQVEPAGAELAPPRRGRILIIDDEPMLGAAVRRMLAAEHDVDTVTAASEALARIARGDRFDVILCDLMMPQMTGMDFYEGLTGVAPEQVTRLVFMTGGAFTPAAREFLDRVPNARIEKPFEVQNLRLMVRSVLTQ